PPRSPAKRPVRKWASTPFRFLPRRAWPSRGTRPTLRSMRRAALSPPGRPRLPTTAFPRRRRSPKLLPLLPLLRPHPCPRRQSRRLLPPRARRSRRSSPRRAIRSAFRPRRFRDERQSRKRLDRPDERVGFLEIPELREVETDGRSLEARPAFCRGGEPGERPREDGERGGFRDGGMEGGEGG